MRRRLKITVIVLAIIAGLLLLAVLAVLLFLWVSPTVGETPDGNAQAAYGQQTELFYDGVFHNENDYSVMTGEKQNESSRKYPGGTVPVVKNPDIRKGEEGSLSVIWCGHSAVLVRLGAQTVFLDPMLSERASPVSFAGPKRFSDPAIEAGDVPEIDVVFLSHDHYDHLDYKTITAIDGRVKAYVVPLGIDCILKGWGVDEDKLHPLAWWESTEIGGVTYTLVPSQHNSGRNPLKANATLWGGLYMNDGHHTVYYTGDTGYYDVFSRVRETLGAVDLMLADSGQYDPAWAQTHMTPSESVQAAKDAQATWYIPIHWGAFVLSNHDWDEPPRLAVEAAGALGVNIATPRIGECADFSRMEQFQEHWWENVG